MNFPMLNTSSHGPLGTRPIVGAHNDYRNADLNVSHIQRAFKFRGPNRGSGPSPPKHARGHKAPQINSHRCGPLLSRQEAVPASGPTQRARPAVPDLYPPVVLAQLLVVSNMIGNNHAVLRGSGQYPMLA